MTTPPHDPNYARLDQRVTGLESSITGIADLVKDLGRKFEERNKTPWAVLVSVGLLLVGVLGVIGAAWKAPMKSIIARQEQNLQTIQESVVPRVEHEYHWQSNIDADVDIKKRLDRIESTVFAGSPGLRP